MKPEWWPGEDHELFTQWAISQGITVNGVAPARFTGRGLGMIATRDIKKGEAMVTVPLKTMVTPQCIPSSLIGKFPGGIPIHALYAAFFTHGDPEDLEKYDLWRKTWPRRQDFEDSMPLMWPEELRASNSEYDNHSATSTIILPPSISGSWNSIRKRKSEHGYETFHQNLLAQQEKRLRDAWVIVRSAFPDTDWETFSYHWLIVNTRSFFYLLPGQEPPEDRNDAMALLPFADYFNHSDVACNVNFDGKQYTFRATKNYEQGEEIYMSYGPHPNDFLFAEYGFFLDGNESETLYLDDIIFRNIGPSLQEELNLQQYYGNYQLTASGTCYRTEIAACMKYMTRRDWRNYVLGRSTKGFNDKKTQATIQEWIKVYIKEADTAIATLDALKSNGEKQVHREKVEMLLRRWKQIKLLCDEGLKIAS